MIYLKLRQRGQMINHKRVERLYSEAKLQVRRRKRKKVPVTERQPLICPKTANNPMERLLKEARRRTKVVGAFPDGHSALMLVSARLRHVSATTWGTRKYTNMKLLEEMDKDAVYSAA
jgi:hypothetical protein